MNTLYTSVNIGISIITQAGQPYAALQCNNPNIEMPSVPPPTSVYNPNQPRVNTIPQSSAASNVQGFQSNPCSGVESFAINTPSYSFGTTQMPDLNAKGDPVTLNRQVPLNQQVLLIAPDRIIGQNQPTTAVSDGQNPTPSTWQQVWLIIFFTFYYAMLGLFSYNFDVKI